MKVVCYDWSMDVNKSVPTAEGVERTLNSYENPDDAAFLQRFFKTGEGQYGAGDIFIGLRVPLTRKISQQFVDLPIGEIEKLLESPVHEHRLCALIIMTKQMKRADDRQQKRLYDLYLRRTDRINNWDLVDASCRDVVGAYLMERPRDRLYKLAHSKDLWERRIAMVSTWQFIRAGQLDDTFQIATMLLHDQHDLIQKATGWMLREAGKKDEAALEAFLEEHAAVMPRTTLRYAIERLDPVRKQWFMGRKTARK